MLARIERQVPRAVTVGIPAAVTRNMAGYQVERVHDTHWGCAVRGSGEHQRDTHWGMAPVP